MPPDSNSTLDTGRPRSHLPLSSGRGLVLVGIALSALTLRTAVTSLTPLLDLLGRVFGFGTVMTGVFGMAPSAAFALFGALTPAIAGRIELERTALLAMLLSAAGLLARAFAGSTTQLLLTSVIALAGMGIGNVVLPPLVKRYFADRVGVVSALYITLLQLGTILPALVAVPLAQAAGWRVSLGSWTLVALAAALPWLTGPRRPRNGEQPAAGELPSGKVWRSPVGWGMVLLFGMSSLIVYAMFTWLPKLLIEAGGSATLGGVMVGWFAALGLVSALTMPVLAVRMTNPFALVVASAAAYLAGFAGLLLAPLDFTVLWVALLGLGPSTFALALTLINLRTRSAAGSAALSGFSQGLGYTFACLGPLLFGWLREISNGWLWPFAFLTACVALLLVGGHAACRPRMLEDSW